MNYRDLFIYWLIKYLRGLIQWVDMRYCLIHIYIYIYIYIYSKWKSREKMPKEDNIQRICIQYILTRQIYTNCYYNRIH